MPEEDDVSAEKEDIEADENEESDEVHGEPDGNDFENGELGPVIQNGSWRSAKTLFGKAVKKTSEERGFSRSARSYVRAHGGSRRAAQTAEAGRSATANLGGFLADVANRGLNATLEAWNLSSVIGKDPQTVFAAISNALAPDGGSPEQAVAREAVDDVLSDLYDRFVSDDNDLSTLDALTGEDVAQAMLNSVICYIYRRWLQELGRQIEEKSISSSEAVQLERETKLFVKDSVTIDFKETNLLTMDWAKDGHAMVERIYHDAYTLFGS